MRALRISAVAAMIAGALFAGDAAPRGPAGTAHLKIRIRKHNVRIVG
jgi:hypothetical protein